MKTIRITLLWIYCLAYMAFADRNVTLAWDSNAPEDDVVAYALIVDGKEQPKTETTTAQVTIPDAKTTITVIAYNSLGQSSPPSAAVIIPASPSNPKGLRVTAILRTTVSTPTP